MCEGLHENGPYLLIVRCSEKHETAVKEKTRFYIIDPIATLYILTLIK